MPTLPKNYRAILIAAAKNGVADPWEIWRDLYNAGFRGEALNGWLRDLKI